MKRAVILANVGTPDKPEAWAVLRYLTQFLNDYRVIDLPWLGRLLLVNGIIIPFRLKNSTRLYKRLWTDKGSPLLYLTESLANKLEKELGSGYTVYTAMRYGKPSLNKVMEEIKKQSFDQVIIVPMFPQYASSTTGTATEKILQTISSWNVIPDTRFIGQFYDHPAYLEAFTKNAEQYELKSYDHIIFSYHGLPDSHVNRIHPGIKVQNCSCISEMPEHGRFCYKASCYETTRLLAKRLGIPCDNYTVAFQSRLSKNWLTPFSDEVVKQLAKDGKKKILVFAPSFVTDCLETVIEIGFEYAEIFREHGGEKLQMAEALNDSDIWAHALKNLIGDR
jgi:protoporphyrin/coproporphyrin ferrochelatase